MYEFSHFLRYGEVRRSHGRYILQLPLTVGRGASDFIKAHFATLARYGINACIRDGPEQKSTSIARQVVSRSTQQQTTDALLHDVVRLFAITQQRGGVGDRAGSACVIHESKRRPQ